MLLQNKAVQNIFENALSRLPERDRPYVYGAIEQSISVLSSEILRLSKLGYRSWGNLDRIRSLDDQIRYLEEVLAAFERDQKKL